MTLSAIRPFGLRDLKITNVLGLDPQDLPGLRLRFAENLSSVEFKSEDGVVGVVSVVESIDWSIESGGISFGAWSLLTGRTSELDGSTPNQMSTLRADVGQNFPYIRIYGQVLGESGDIHIKIFKAKVTSFSGEFRDREFYITECSGIGVKDSTNGVYQLIQHETQVSL